MGRYSPFQRAILVFLPAFLLFLLLFWFLTEDVSLGTLAWSALKPSLLIGGGAWTLFSIRDLRRQVAALRSELERLKNKE